jgi:hypothetical protein
VTSLLSHAGATLLRLASNAAAEVTLNMAQCCCQVGVVYGMMYMVSHADDSAAKSFW